MGSFKGSKDLLGEKGREEKYTKTSRQGSSSSSPMILSSVLPKPPPLKSWPFRCQHLNPLQTLIRKHASRNNFWSHEGQAPTMPSIVFTSLSLSASEYRVAPSPQFPGKTSMVLNATLLPHLYRQVWGPPHPQHADWFKFITTTTSASLILVSDPNFPSLFEFLFP